MHNQSINQSITKVLIYNFGESLHLRRERKKGFGPVLHLYCDKQLALTSDDGGTERLPSATFFLSACLKIVKLISIV